MKRLSQHIHIQKGVSYVFSLLAFALILTLIITQVGVVSAQQQRDGAVSIDVSAADQAAALSFWNHAAIESAKPMAMVDNGTPHATTAGLDVPTFSFGSSSPAGKAAPGAAAVARQAYAAEWKVSNAAAATEASTEGTSGVYTSYTVNSWAPAQTIYPHAWVGRLSFSTSGGTSYCSATAISGNNFVTAAHCVYDTTNNVWYSKWVFTPAYRAGSAPYGSFAATACSILSAWVNLTGSYSISTWTRYDVAVCTVGKNSAAQTLNTAVGFAGRTWNAGYTQNVFNMGYPWKDYNLVAISSAGSYLRTCTSETFQYTTDVLGGGCNWGPGISGGPWLLKYAPPVVSGNVDSVNSGLFQGQQNLYGIRFTSSNIVVVCTARAC